MTAYLIKTRFAFKFRDLKNHCKSEWTSRIVTKKASQETWLAKMVFKGSHEIERCWIELKIHWSINFYLKKKWDNVQRWLKHQIREKTVKEIIQASGDKEWKTYSWSNIFTLNCINNNCRERFSVFWGLVVTVKGVSWLRLFAF